MNYKKMLRKKHKIYGSFAMTGMAILIILLIIGVVVYFVYIAKPSGVPRGEECSLFYNPERSDCQAGLLCGSDHTMSPPYQTCMTIQDCIDNEFTNGAFEGSVVCFKEYIYDSGV